MQINNTIRTSVVMAAFFSLAIPAASADQTTTTTTTKYVDSSGDPTSSVTTSRRTIIAPASTILSTAPSGVVYFRSASPEILVTTLSGRRKSLSEQIDQACARGEITGNKADAMKRELSRIDRESSSPSISYAKAVMFAQDLDLIGDQYRTIVTTTTPSPYVPIITGSSFTVSSGQVLRLDDLSVRRAELEGRVMKDLLQGRLSDSQASTLRSKLESLGNEQAIYSANGSLNDKEARHLYNEFDRVASDIERIAGKDNTKEND